MLKNAQPSELFLGAILRAYDKAKAREGQVTCSKLWDYIVMECMRVCGGFTRMFAWDESKAKNKNRIRTIMETIERGHVPGLRVDDRGRVCEG